jgi:cobalt-precorrin 5A hydrolase / precorrin-3B C17-methyltransferase
MVKPVFVALNQEGVATARRLMAPYPEALLYGAEHRTSGVDRSFSQFKDTLQELFTAGQPIVGLCAAGILIRALAPLLQNSATEPAVIAVASDGSAVVPLLGGLHGANDLAAQLAQLLDIHPAVTTTGDLRFQTTLLDPPPGYRLANPEAGKKFLADCIAGAKIQLQGAAPWIESSQLPLDLEGSHRIVVSDRTIAIPSDCLLYHPATLVVEVEAFGPRAGQLVPTLAKLLKSKHLSLASVAGVLTPQGGNGEIRELARHYQWPLRVIDGPWEQGNPLRLQRGDYKITLRRLKTPVAIDTIGRSLGQLWVVGTGPGPADWLTPEVKKVLQGATDWVGYSSYLDLAEPWRTGQQRHASDNREELERARLALGLAAEGRSVVIISSGDPGIFAMGAAVMEVMDTDRHPDWERVELHLCPGVSAMQASAAQVGAPLGHDFCVISLSDRLKPWSVVERRLILAAQGDFAMALYNPVSQDRPWQLGKAISLLREYRAKTTPVVVAHNVGRSGQRVVIKTLDTLTPADADMRTTILVGSSQTKIIDQAGWQRWVYTPRSYH